MNTVTVKWSYCLEHFARHMQDARGKCIAQDPADMTLKGFVYLGHIGGGWYRYRTPSQTLPLDWQMAIERQETLTDILAMQDEPDF